MARRSVRRFYGRKRMVTGAGVIPVFAAFIFLESMAPAAAHCRLLEPRLCMHM